MNHFQSSEESPRDWSNWLVGDIRLLVLIGGLVVVAGLSSLMVLPRMEDPILAKRVAIIVTRMPGADAARVESLITEKIELRLREVEQIKEMRSQSRPGISSITIELLDSVVDSDEVWSSVRGKIEDALPELPAKEQLVMVGEEEELVIPPPKVAELPVNEQLVMVGEEEVL